MKRLFFVLLILISAQAMSQGRRFPFYTPAAVVAASGFLYTSDGHELYGSDGHILAAEQPDAAFNTLLPQDNLFIRSHHEALTVFVPRLDRDVFGVFVADEGYLELHKDTNQRSPG